MTWGRKESDLRTVEGFRVGRLKKRSGKTAAFKFFSFLWGEDS